MDPPCCIVDKTMKDQARSPTGGRAERLALVRSRLARVSSWRRTVLSVRRPPWSALSVADQHERS